MSFPRVINTVLGCTLVTKILPSLDKREICLSAYLDISKAFDTINHDVMWKKRHYYGIRGNALAWFNSYLLHRRQYVCYKGVSSEVQEVDYYGVPQGSVLGPLLFIIYANDIPHSIAHGTTIMYAYDTTVLVKGTDMQSAYDHMNVTLNGLSDYDYIQMLNQINLLWYYFWYFSPYL